MIGKKILNYEIKSLLGEGGMGNVYLAEHEQLGRKVAVKMLHPRLTSNESLRERFKNEASAMAHLQHPNIVTLYDYTESEDGLFLIMEYVEGHELDHYIKNVTGPIGEEEIEKIMAQTLGAFEYAHAKGIVHRDIKPSNILLTAEGQVKVLDFGIAKLLDADKTLTKTGTQMGTVLYMSPEQVKGEKVDQRSDIYALGVTLFQMATGQAPYRSDTTEFEVYNQIVRDPLPKASTIYPGASEKIDTIIAKATAKDLKNRYQNCEEFLADFKNTSVASIEKTVVKTVSKKNKSSEKAIQTKKEETFQPVKKNTGKKALIVALTISILVGGYFIVDNFILNSNESEEANTTAESIAGESVYVLSGVLNFRSDNNVNASIIEELPFGERIELVGAAENPVYEKDLKIVWQKANWQGKTGWIARTIDDQDVVGDVDTYEDFNKLFSSLYDHEAGYGEMKVWAYTALIDYIKEQDWLGRYTIRNDPLDIRQEGLKTVLRFRQSLNEKDKDEPYDFVTLLESPEDKIVVYLRSDSDNSGRVIDWITVPNHVNYLTKKKKGEEYASNGSYGINLNEIKETRIGAADKDGVITNWLVPSFNQLEMDELRFIEASEALNLLANEADGYVFVSETNWYDFNRNGKIVSSDTYWQVSKDNRSNSFSAKQYSLVFGNWKYKNSFSSEWKETRYVTKDYERAKLFIDIELNRLVLYIRDDSGNELTFYGCVESEIIENATIKWSVDGDEFYGY